MLIRNLADRKVTRTASCNTSEPMSKAVARGKTEPFHQAFIFQAVSRQAFYRLRQQETVVPFANSKPRFPQSNHKH